MSGALDSNIVIDGPRADVTGRGAFLVRLFGNAVIGQALLSAASLGVGLLLIRHSTDTQYGAYVLVINAILLLTSLQSAFFAPAMVLRMAPLDRQARGAVVGGLYSGQRRMLFVVVGACLFIDGALAAGGVIAGRTAVLVAFGAMAAGAALHREFFRIALQAHRRAFEVLRGDGAYVVLLVGGAALAIQTEVPIAVALVTMTCAALVAGTLLSRQLRHSEAWDTRGVPGLLRQVAPGAAWAVAGAATHWLFSQGYSYIVAMTLDVAAVAAIATTRLLLMPINLVSTGITSLMLPLTTGWLRERSALWVLRRLLAISGLLIVATGFYVVVMWELRDWIFSNLLRKQFADRDQLLGLWSLIVVLMLVRDQLLYLPLARGRFRALTMVALIGAALSLVTTYWGMVHYGVTGALFGVIAGELASVAGISVLTRRELRSGASVTVEPQVAASLDKAA